MDPKLPENFWSDISHQLRSPFNSIKIMLSLAQKHPEKLTESLNTIDIKCDLTLKRIDLLILLMRLKEKSITPLFEFFDFIEILKIRINPQSKLNNSAAKSQIMADKQLISKCLELIFTNSSPSNEITLTNTKSYILLTLKNFASEKDKDIILEKFESEYICNEILKLHGGELIIAHENYKTIYKLKLPFKPNYHS